MEKQTIELKGTWSRGCRMAGAGSRTARASHKTSRPILWLDSATTYIIINFIVFSIIVISIVVCQCQCTQLGNLCQYFCSIGIDLHRNQIATENSQTMTNGVFRQTEIGLDHSLLLQLLHEKIDKVEVD